MDEQTARTVQWVLERGKLLFGIDRAAWVASDDMLAHMPRDQQRSLAGYVVDREPGGMVTIFYAREGRQLVAAYRGHVRERGVESREIFPAGQRPPLTPTQQRMAMALNQLRAASPRLDMCSQSRPNLAAIPPDRPDAPVDVYVMTPQTANDTVPLGGHHRLTIGADGRITAQRAFTNSCINVPTTAAEHRPEVSLVSHLLDTTPTEIHVFTVLASGLPLYVMMEQRVWRVNADSITFLADDSQTPQVRHR